MTNHNETGAIRQRGLNMQNHYELLGIEQGASDELVLAMGKEALKEWSMRKMDPKKKAQGIARIEKAVSELTDPVGRKRHSDWIESRCIRDECVQRKSNKDDPYGVKECVIIKRLTKFGWGFGGMEVMVCQRGVDTGADFISAWEIDKLTAHPTNIEPWIYLEGKKKKIKILFGKGEKNACLESLKAIEGFIASNWVERCLNVTNSSGHIDIGGAEFKADGISVRIKGMGVDKTCIESYKDVKVKVNEGYFDLIGKWGRSEPLSCRFEWAKDVNSYWAPHLFNALDALNKEKEILIASSENEI